MIDVTAWIKIFLQKLNETFDSRLWFVGLQGSGLSKTVEV